MPEIIEVEMYRRAAAPVVGRTITKVIAPDSWFCKGTTPRELKAAFSWVRKLFPKAEDTHFCIRMSKVYQDM